MVRLFAVLGCGSGFLAVVLGAFGAHVLQTRLSQADFVIFEVAVRYQMYHALAILAVALMLDRWPGTTGVWAAWAFVFGTLIFSGSLYLLVMTGARSLGAVTPVGGLGFLLGWGLLALHLWRSL